MTSLTSKIYSFTFPGSWLNDGDNKFVFALPFNYSGGGETLDLATRTLKNMPLTFSPLKKMSISASTRERICWAYVLADSC